MQAYYCVPAVFKKEMPDLNLSTYGKQYCSGLIQVADNQVTVVLSDKQSCPAPGTHLIGHLRTLCQDTGQWTKATYLYSKENDFCTKSYDISFQKAQLLVTKILPGMTRTQVWEILKDWVMIGGSFTEQYYLHPDILLEVKFDEPNGAYSMDNKIIDPVVIKKTTMPQPQTLK